MGWLGYDYLFLVAVTDLWMVYCSAKLVRFRTIEEGRVQIRRLYLAWGLFVIVFAFSRIFLYALPNPSPGTSRHLFPKNQNKVYTDPGSILNCILSGAFQHDNLNETVTPKES